MRHAWLLGLCLLSTGAALSRPMQAEAQSGTEDAAAKAFGEGRKLWDKKDFQGALPLFQKAVDASSSPNARLYLARCLRETGQLAAAYDEMAITVRDARASAEKDERYVATRDAAAAELALLEAKVAKLVITVDSTLSGYSVTLNGSMLDASRLGKPLTVAPGAVRVVASKEGSPPVERAIQAAAGATENVTLAALPSADRPGPVVPPAGASAASEQSGGGFGVVRGVGIGVAALGVGGFVAFAVGTVQADSSLAALEEACGDGPCPDASYQEEIDSGKTSELVSFVGLGVGVAGVVAGTLMIALGGPSAPEKSAFMPTGNGFRVRF